MPESVSANILASAQFAQTVGQIGTESLDLMLP